MIPKLHRLIIASFLAILPYAARVDANGYAIQHQSAIAMGQANAITAGVTDPSAVYYNPAALTEIQGNQLLFSPVYINVISSVENSGRTAYNQGRHNFLVSGFANFHVTQSRYLPGAAEHKTDAPVPEYDLLSSRDNQLTLGLGIYTPFGLRTRYDDRFVRFAAKTTNLTTMFVTPAIAWRPSKFFSIGAGLSYVYASAELSRKICLNPINNCNPSGGALEGKLKLTDSTNAFAYNVGILITPVDELKLGFSYRGRTDLRFDSANVDLKGPFDPRKTKADVSTVPLPPVVNAGLFWQITNDWGAEFVYEYTRWSELEQLAAKFHPASTVVPLGVPLSGFEFPQNWRDTSGVRFGTWFRLPKLFGDDTDLILRGGFALEQTPIPDSTLSPAIPGADSLQLTAGIGYRYERWSFHIAYMAAFFKERTVTNKELEGGPGAAIPFTGAPGSDTYTLFNNVVFVSISYSFGGDKHIGAE